MLLLHVINERSFRISIIDCYSKILPLEYHEPEIHKKKLASHKYIIRKSHGSHLCVRAAYMPAILIMSY